MRKTLEIMGKVVKSLLSNNFVSNKKITLVEEKENYKTDQANAKLLNNFFSNIMKNIEISQYNQVDQISQNIKVPVINGIIRYKNHPSIIAIKERCTNSKSSFSFIEKIMF